MKIALAIPYGEPSSDMPSITLRKLKSILKCYYQDQILILSTQLSIYKIK